MKEYIPHKLINLASTVEVDPILMGCLSRAFEWANNMGLQGKKVNSLTRVQESNDMIPEQSIWCKIECTEEERKKFDEMEEKYIKAYLGITE